MTAGGERIEGAVIEQRLQGCLCPGQRGQELIIDILALELRTKSHIDMV